MTSPDESSQRVEPTPLEAQTSRRDNDEDEIGVDRESRTLEQHRAGPQHLPLCMERWRTRTGDLLGAITMKPGALLWRGLV
jgi:hypothetical protein